MAIFDKASCSVQWESYLEVAKGISLPRAKQYKDNQSEDSLEADRRSLLCE